MQIKLKNSKQIGDTLHKYYTGAKIHNLTVLGKFLNRNILNILKFLPGSLYLVQSANYHIYQLHTLGKIHEDFTKNIFHLNLVINISQYLNVSFPT